MSTTAKTKQNGGSGSSKESGATNGKSEMEYFQAERDRLKSAREKYLSETKKPEKREYFPDIYTSLEPYTDLEVYDKALNAPAETPHYQYKTRNTAKGLCDPWVSYQMDVKFDSERPDTASTTEKENDEHKSAKRATQKEKDNHKSERTRRNDSPSSRKTRNKEESKQSQEKEKKKEQDGKKKVERTSIYPTVKAERNDMTGKDLNYGHVPQLRQELLKTYSTNANRRIERDYRLTKEYLQKHEHDHVADNHSDSWSTIRQAYFAYLQNSPGSRRAVHECIRQVEKENKKKSAAKKKSDHGSSSDLKDNNDDQAEKHEENKAS